MTETPAEPEVEIARPAIVPATSHRAAICTWAMFCIANRQHISYAEVRPIPVGLPPGHLPFATDCSGFVVLMAKWAGCKTDPSGQHFDGEGDTADILAFCNEIPAEHVEPGDLGLFNPHGPNNEQHVAVAVGKGPDGIGGLGPTGSGTPPGEFRMVSHGQPGDPEVNTSGNIAIAVGRAFHLPGPAPIAWLRWIEP